MSHEPVPVSLSALNSLTGKTIDSLDFARAGRELAGQIAVVDMVRLQGLLLDDVGAVNVALVGEIDEERQPWLHLEVRGELSLVCQRCLGRLAHVLEIDARLRLIRPGEPWPEDELEDGSGGEANDAIEADEALALLSLVEEEIVLALPYAPMHATCELPDEGELNRKASPFAALAVLKKH